MLPYSSRECYALPHIIPTSDTDWDTSVIDSTKAEVGSWFDTALYSSKLESHGTFDMHGEYINLSIVQYTEI